MIVFLQKRWVYHFLIWMSFFLLVPIMNVLNGESQSFFELLLEMMGYFWIIIPLVYLNFYLKDRLFGARKYGWYAVAVVGQVLLGVGLYQLEYLIFPSLQQNVLQDASNVFFVMLLAVGLQYLKRGIVGQFQLQELKAKTAQIELNALKAQINPHFLFNTLNNIYAVNQFDSAKGSEMIMELSEVMRYHLHFSKIDKVPLEDEIQLLKSYIELERLRLQNNCEVRVEVDRADSTIQIAPLILLPFLENAFKHGTHPTQPCFVHLSIWSDRQSLQVVIENSKIAHKKVVKTHIGMDNTQRRLQLVYPEKHTLDIQENHELFRVHLTISL